MQVWAEIGRKVVVLVYVTVLSLIPGIRSHSSSQIPEQRKNTTRGLQQVFSNAVAKSRVALATIGAVFLLIVRLRRVSCSVDNWIDALDFDCHGNDRW